MTRDLYVEGPGVEDAPVRRTRDLATRPVIGKRTLAHDGEIAGAAPAVQRRVDAHVAADPTAVHAAAARGIATPASALPHGGTIQRLFGRHDVSSVQAHTGAEAAASAREMGAEAYATGDHVVLGQATDLFTVAHEAAHVVQQRAGVQLKGGVGAVGDAYERQADAVAARVVRGESAEAALGEPAHGGGAGQVQRTPDTGASDATGATAVRDAAGAHGREREDDDGAAAAAAPVQKQVSIHTERGTRVVIVNGRARDHGQSGRVLRRSTQRRDCLVVEFDNEPGVGYRVYLDEMDYEPERRGAQPKERARPDSSASDRLWAPTGQPSGTWQNCGHFAFQDEFMAAEQSVERITALAGTAGLVVTGSAASATVVVYGSGAFWSHAIRKVEGRWEEVNMAGGVHRRYTGPEDPPPVNQGDRIVLMLRPA